MLVLRDPAEVENICDPGMRKLVARRFAEILAGEVHDRERHGFMIVVEPADTVDAIEEESGFAVLRDFFDEVGFGDPEFQPSAEAIEEHSGCYELVFITNDEGAGVTIFVPKVEGVDPELLDMCAQFAAPAREEVPRLLQPTARYRLG